VAVTYEGASINGGTGGGAFVAWPTHQTGDLGIIIQECSGDDTPATPTTGGVGWTLIATETDTGDSAGSNLSLWYRFAASASEPNPTIPDPGNHQQVAITVWRGVDVTTPVEVSSKAARSSVSTATFPAVTTVTDSALVVLVGSCPIDTLGDRYDTNWTNPSLSSVTHGARTNTNQGNGGGFAFGYGTKATAGDTGTSTVSLLASFTHAVVTFALRVDGATPAPGPAKFLSEFTITQVGFRGQQL
jgi:hypothetical protein